MPNTPPPSFSLPLPPGNPSPTCLRATQLDFQFPAMPLSNFFSIFSRARVSSGAGNKEEPELCIVLLGKAGVGKSAAGNTLLGQEKFDSAFSAKPTTQNVKKESGEYKGQKFYVIDTPAVSSSKSLKKHKREIKKLCKPSPYILVFVTTVGRFTPEDKKTAKKVKKVFGKKSRKRMVVLFTHKEDLKGEPLEDYVEESKNKALLKLVKECGNRYFALNNKAAGEEKEEVSELMGKLWEMLHENGSKPCIEKGKEGERRNKKK